MTWKLIYFGLIVLMCNRYKFWVNYEKRRYFYQWKWAKKGDFENPKVINCNFSTKSVPLSGPPVSKSIKSRFTSFISWSKKKLQNLKFCWQVCFMLIYLRKETRKVSKFQKYLNCNLLLINDLRDFLTARTIYLFVIKVFFQLQKLWSLFLFQV